MIPTPRMPHSASLNLPVTPSVEKSVIAACDYSTQQPNTFCTGNLLPNDYTSNAGVYEGVPSVVVQRVSSQVIFTPKFSDTHSSGNSEPSNNDGQSTTVTQLQGREYISGQNNCLSPYFGVHAGIGMRSNLQQNPSSHNFQRDAPNGGLDFIGNKKQLVHEAPVSDSYLNALPYGNSSEHLHQHFDQKRLAPGEGSVMNGVYLTGNGSLYDIATFTGSPINNLDMDHFSIHSKSKTNSLIASEPNLQAFKQKTHIKPDMLDSSSKINMRASPFSQQLKFQHQPLQIGPPFEHNTQFVQHLAKQQTEHCPHLVGNEELHSSEFQNQFQQMTDTGDGSNAAQCQPSGVGQDISASVNSQHMHTREQDPDSQIKFTYVSAREETESMLQEQRHPNSLEKPHILYQSSSEQPVQNLSQRIRGHDEAWRSSLSSEGSTTVYPAASRRASVPQQEIYNSQRWLLFLMHARRCTFPEGKCHSVDCIKVQRLLKHMKACNLEQCPYPCCSNTKKLMKHHKSCNSQECQICVPVHCYLLRRAHCRTSDSGLPNSKKGSRKNFDARGGAGLQSETIQSTAETSEDGQSSLKRKKTELSSPYSQIKVEKSPASILALSLPRSSGDAQKQVCPEVGNADTDLMMAEPPLRSGAGSLNSCENKADKGVDSYCMKHEVEPYVPPDVEPYIPHDVEPYIPTEPDGPVRQEGMEIEQEVNQDKVEIKQECAVLHSEDAAIINSRKPKEQGVSLTKVFNPEQVREHIAGPDKQEGNIDVEQGINQANSQIQLESTVLHSEQAATMNLGKPKVQGASLTDLFNPKQVREHVAGLVKQEGIHIVQGTDQDKLQDHPATTKLAKPKVQGVSLTEIFTPEQVKEHITGLRQWIGQSKAKAEKNQAMKHSMSENSCQLCAVEKLTLEPPPIYCMHCAARIKRNTMYYTIAAAETRYYFCISCYNDTRGDNIMVYGTAICKASMETKKNDEEIEESWVQCDKCEAWQHQICALFNGRRNDGGQAEYACPYCYIGEIERGERKPLPQSSVLGAKDLPRTILSDHIEQRLFRRLKQERRERARVLGKHIDEVPGAESLVVRVVSSVDKKLEVKQQFLEIFQEENYPTEFPYKSKVILLFQKIEGVEVCLFGMYVQEFGSECQLPNQRRVYLSYLDSVKYFRPEIKTISGEALRTFVYHEILIGYLEYCKRRGFVSCYIWACPPVKGEDYILYCHPEIQKTPKSDKLREWYLSMLRKAAKENIVVDLTNLYDHFFVSTGECKAKVTAARLPYFDGDYWPGAAEDFLNQLSQEENEKKQQKKGKLKRIITKRSLKDVLLMRKLSTSICPMKEDFIMVHLLHSCTHCCNLMVSGNRWACNKCKNFQLCDKCHDAEDRLCERDRHPICDRDKHVLHPVEVRDVPADTKDEDEILESEFFDTRQAFLSLCQGNHYQYNTLRRAKHSSMMVLYHLHNPTAPAFVTTCNVCQNDIEAGQGWRCEICPDYDVCDVCFMKDGSVDHPHKLTNHPSIADCYAQNKEARQKRVLQLRKTLDLLVHASQCRSQHCSYTNCRRVKALFRHGMQCKIRASKGCGLCKKMWYILKLHARACKEPECHVPRCRDLKEHSQRLQQQSDSRRRAAVMEMVRQRAEEVAGNTS